MHSIGQTKTVAVPKGRKDWGYPELKHAIGCFILPAGDLNMERFRLLPNYFSV